MTDAPLKFRLVKGNAETASDAIVSIVLVAAMYYMLHPETYAQHKAAISERWDRLQYRLSIWRTRKSIQSLPEV